MSAPEVPRAPDAPGPRDMLMDVSRLVWRVWRGGLPTGVDRVCLAYLHRFGPRAFAVVQRGGLRFVLSAAGSERLFQILLNGGGGAKAALLRFLFTAWRGARRTPPRQGMIYLNVGHTGLDEASLPAWIAANGVRAVYLVHDLIPISHPEYCRPAEGAKHRRRMENVLRSAAGIIGNSAATLDDLAAFALAQGALMPPTLAAWISGKPLPTKVVPKRLPVPYFVTVGTIEARKNHLLLLDIWRRLVPDLESKAPTLVIVGQRGWEAERVFAILDDLGPLQGHVLELGHCSDDELGGWIAGAAAVLMPSFAEGFGLPVIEAFQLETPVIASNLPVFREIAGDIPAYLDPRDAVGWERTIRGYVSDRRDADRQRALIRHWSPPGWESHFTAVEAWLSSL